MTTMSMELREHAAVAALVQPAMLGIKPEWLDKTGRATELSTDLIDLESGTNEKAGSVVRLK